LIDQRPFMVEQRASIGAPWQPYARCIARGTALCVLRELVARIGIDRVRIVPAAPMQADTLSATTAPQSGAYGAAPRLSATYPPVSQETRP
jgi:hypothetical protein